VCTVVDFFCQWEAVQAWTGDTERKMCFISLNKYLDTLFVTRVAGTYACYSTVRTTA
jgi:hypothetical protein